jgi:transcriptional regulator with XRE-family HTH domain
LGQGELAKMARISTPYLSLLESGRRKPSIRVIKKLEDALALPDGLLSILATGESPGEIIEPKRVAKLLELLDSIDVNLKDLSQYLVRYGKQAVIAE